MPKLLLLLVFGPLLLVAAVLVSPLATLYFLFDRLCDCIEDFKPQARRQRKRRGPGLASLGKLLNQIPTRVPTPDNS